MQAGTSADAVALPGLGRELLEGVRVEASAGFAAWLLGERRRLQSIGGAVLREGALRALAAGNERSAVELATRLVGADPLDEDAHVLLVRAFAATGDESAVQQQLTASAELFRVELGEDIAPALYAAARIGSAPPRAPGDTRAAAEAHLESGEAALGAGAFDVGLEELRAAVDAAAGDPGLEATMLFSLGSALVHAAHGRDEDGSAALHRAIAAADAMGDRRTSAAAHRELGYVELLRADYARGLVLLQRAEELADGDELELSRIRSVRAAVFGDVGRHEEADAEFEGAIALADGVGNVRQHAWAATIQGRGQLLRDERRGGRGDPGRCARSHARRALDRVPVAAGVAPRRGVAADRAGRTAPPRYSSTRSRSDARSTTRAGRRTRCAGSGCCRRRAATSRRGSRRWTTRSRGACASATPTSGSAAT